MRASASGLTRSKNVLEMGRWRVEGERDGERGGSAISAQNVAQVGLWRVLAAFVKKKKRGRRVRERERERI